MLMGRAGAAVVLCLIGLLGRETRRRAGDADYYVAWQGVTRHYSVHAPATGARGRVLPVVLVLHGAGGSGAGVIRQGHWSELSDADGFLVVAPDAEPADLSLMARPLTNPTAWNDGSGRGPWAHRDVDDVGFIGHVLDDVARRYSIDRTRVYATGFSSGASMTWRLGAELADRLAAIAPVSGHLWLNPSALPHPLPALFIVGTADPLNPLAGGEAPNPWGGTEVKPPLLSSPAKWARLLHCAAEPPQGVNERGLEIRVYAGCSAELWVELVDGLGHRWPGGLDLLPDRLVGPASSRLDASREIWDFFARHAWTGVGPPPPSEPSAKR